MGTRLSLHSPFVISTRHSRVSTVECQEFGMDKLQEAIARHGNVWSLETNKEMNELYEALHAPLASQFAEKITVEKGVKYGPHDRNRLDIYKPKAVTEHRLPITVFLHGGGFTSGDNDITPSLHGNIGNYFANNNCISILATYRLLPEARYPSGAEDVTAALRYVQQNAASLGGDPAHITAIGQSAGAAHLAMAAFSGMLLPRPSEGLLLPLRGMVLLSPPLSYDLRQERRKKNMLLYYGAASEAEVMSRTAVSLFRDASSEDLEAVVRGSKLLLMVAEMDPNEIVDGNLEFVQAYRTRFRRLPRFEVMMGHNHISNTLGIGLPDDVVGKRILEFIRE